MFEIEVRREFSAAHCLKGYDGPCSRLHGHNYSVTVTLRADHLDELGISVDFKKLKAALDGILGDYDHRNLSELPDFAECNPTSEKLAMVIFNRLASQMDDGRVRMHSVRIGESSNSAATYFGE